MQYTLQQLKDNVFSDVYKVYDVFKDFFGERNTDLQGTPSDDDFADLTVKYWSEKKCLYDVSNDELESLRRISSYNSYSILVHWPEVTVTNEYDRSVKIYDLYANVPVAYYGHFTSPYRFSLNKSTYTMEQWQSGYLHSHTPRILSINGIYYKDFQNPCLGNGPIYNTIQTLISNSDPVLWMLFCNELDMYVHVESVKGTPYIRLESIGTPLTICNSVMNSFSSVQSYCYSESTLGVLKGFVKYYLQNGNMRFCFCDGAFDIGMSYYEYVIDISNSFIKYFNRGNIPFSEAELLSKEILQKVKTSNGVLCNVEDNADIFPPVGRKLFKFKGKDVCLRVLGVEEKDNGSNLVTVLSHECAMIILENILLTINYRFKHDTVEQEGGTGSSQNTENVCFTTYK